MSSLPQRFPNLFTLRVQLQRLPERISGTLVVLHIEKISIQWEGGIYKWKECVRLKGESVQAAVPSWSWGLHLHDTRPWTNRDASFCTCGHLPELVPHVSYAASRGSGWHTWLHQMGLHQVPVFTMSKYAVSLAQQVGATVMNGYINRLTGSAKHLVAFSLVYLCAIISHQNYLLCDLFYCS
jgi:hypothetical protein